VVRLKEWRAGVAKSLNLSIPPFNNWVAARNVLANMGETITAALPGPQLNGSGLAAVNIADPNDKQDAVTLGYLQKQLNDIQNTQNTATTNNNSTTTTSTSSSNSIIYSLSLLVPLAIGSDLCPKQYILQSMTPIFLQAVVKQPPIGGALQISLYYGSFDMSTTSLVGSFNIVAGSYFSTISPSTSVIKGNYWRVDITSVGSTFPGAGLTITIQ